MEQTIVYKYVERSSGDKFRSPSLSPRSKWSVIYVPNKFVYAPKGTRLFAFRTAQAAKDWLDDLKERALYELWCCVGLDAQKQFFCTMGNFTKFWRNEAEGEDVIPCPQGTVSCRAIKLIRRIPLCYII